MKKLIGKNILRKILVVPVSLLFILSCNTTQTETPVAPAPQKRQIGDAPTFPEKTIRDTAKSLRQINVDQKVRPRASGTQAVAPAPTAMSAAENQLVADAKLTATDGAYAEGSRGSESREMWQYGLFGFAALSAVAFALFVRKRREQ